MDRSRMRSADFKERTKQDNGGRTMEEMAMGKTGETETKRKEWEERQEAETTMMTEKGEKSGRMEQQIRLLQRHGLENSTVLGRDNHIQHSSPMQRRSQTGD